MPWLAVVLVVTAVVWLALFVVRLHAHQAFVDDYLYATTSRSLTGGGGFLHNVLHTGQTSPLVPVLAVPGTWLGGLYGAMTVQLPLLLLLVAGAFVLARRWIAPMPSAVVALVVGLNCGVLGYSVMLNFSTAATAALLWCLAAYVASDRLRSVRWSVVFGFAAAALVLSRTMAPVYAAPLALVLGVDLCLDRLRNRPGSWRPAALAAGIALVCAGPWWLVSGPTAYQYLVGAGYRTATDSATQGWQWSPGALVARVAWELDSLGQLQAVVLGAAVAYSVGVMAVRWRTLARGTMLLVPCWVVLCTLLLSTSGNLGTGFGLPVIAAVVVWCGVVIVRGPRPGRAVAAAVVSVVVLVTAVGVGATFTSGTGKILHGPPYRILAITNGATPRSNLDQVMAEVAHSSRTRSGTRTGSAGLVPGGWPAGWLLLTVNAPLLNYNGVAWNLGDTGVYPPTTSVALATEDMRGAGAVVVASFGLLLSIYSEVDQTAMVVAAQKLGLVPVRHWVISPGNYAVMWARGPVDPGALALATRPQVVRPEAGSSVHGAFYLVSGFSGMSPASVLFQLTGPGLAHPLDLPATPTEFGWLNRWTSTAVPNGTYEVQVVSTSAAGVTRSPPVTFHVAN